MKIKPDSRQEKGWTDLTDSLYSLRKDIFHMIEKRIGPIFNVFCVGSPLHVKFAMSTLPFCLEHRQCYVVISDFKYSTDKSGNQYGWGIAEYSTPEKLFGKKFTDAVYKRSPEESYQKVLKQFRKILPGAGIEEIERILR